MMQSVFFYSPLLGLKDGVFLVLKLVIILFFNENFLIFCRMKEGEVLNLCLIFSSISKVFWPSIFGLTYYIHCCIINVVVSYIQW